MASFIVEGGEYLGQCPGRCGRALKYGIAVDPDEPAGESLRRVLVHEAPACPYFSRNKIDQILADQKRIAKA